MASSLSVQAPGSSAPRGGSTDTGARLHQLVSELFPYCRSITGEGFRATLRRLQRNIPLTIQEVPSGTEVFDWVVPKEWNVRDAWIKDSSGRKVVDFEKSNLHVVGYSVPVRKTVTLEQLRPHLHSLPEMPDWIPYRTSYYKETWGFCLSHRQLQSLGQGVYEVFIDSTLEDGHLTYGELFVRGATDTEVLVSSHACHPSLANDNLSGVVVASELARRLCNRALRYSYRFLWLPGTIGAITWLALNEAHLSKISHGLVLSCVGDPGGFTYKRSRQGDAEIDRVVEHVLTHSDADFRLTAFSPLGYDERQYCSPGINLPVGCFLRTPHGQYVQYHTSADDLSFVTSQALEGSLATLTRVVEVLEANLRYVNLNPKCEPQLGRRGLYRTIGGTSNAADEEALLWVLNFSDGQHSLLDIAQRANLPMWKLAAAAARLTEHGLLRREQSST
jgi:aminopeptidase-like protein